MADKRKSGRGGSPKEPKEPKGKRGHRNDAAGRPALGVINGGKSKAPRNIPGTGARITLARWKEMESWWLNEDRNIREFARKFGMAERTAHRLVHEGVRRPKLPPLSQRAAEHDARATKIDNVAAERQLALEATEWAKSKRSNLQAIRNARSVVALVQNELVAKYSALGARPLNGYTTPQLRELLVLAKQMAAALKDLGEEERKWIHGVAPETADANIDSPFALLSPDQLDFIESTGRVPPGVDPAVVDDFFKRMGLDTTVS